MFVQRDTRTSTTLVETNLVTAQSDRKPFGKQFAVLGFFDGTQKKRRREKTEQTKHTKINYR